MSTESRSVPTADHRATRDRIVGWKVTVDYSGPAGYDQLADVIDAALHDKKLCGCSDDSPHGYVISGEVVFDD